MLKHENSTTLKCQNAKTLKRKNAKMMLMPCPSAQKKYFLYGQNSFCPRQNIFIPDKKFCPKLKSTFLLVKCMENNFLAMKKNFP